MGASIRFGPPPPSALAPALGFTARTRSVGMRCPAAGAVFGVSPQRPPLIRRSFLTCGLCSSRWFSFSTLAASGPVASQGLFHGQASRQILSKHLDLFRRVPRVRGSKARRSAGDRANSPAFTRRPVEHREIPRIWRSRRGTARAVAHRHQRPRRAKRRWIMKSTVNEAAAGALKEYCRRETCTDVAAGRTTTDGCASSTRPAPGKEPASDPSGRAARRRGDQHHRCADRIARRRPRRLSRRLDPAGAAAQDHAGRGEFLQPACRGGKRGRRRPSGL